MPQFSFILAFFVSGLPAIFPKCGLNPLVHSRYPLVERCRTLPLHKTLQKQRMLQWLADLSSRLVLPQIGVVEPIIPIFLKSSQVMFLA